MMEVDSAKLLQLIAESHTHPKNNLQCLGLPRHEEECPRYAVGTAFDKLKFSKRSVSASVNYSPSWKDSEVLREHLLPNRAFG
jgi:hypothetical protein